MDIQALLIALTWQVPLTTGLVYVIRTAFKLAKRWVPLTAVLIGALIGGATIGWTTAGILVGIIIGLASSGLWDLGKVTTSGK